MRVGSALAIEYDPSAGWEVDSSIRAIGGIDQRVREFNVRKGLCAAGCTRWETQRLLRGAVPLLERNLDLHIGTRRGCIDGGRYFLQMQAYDPPG